MDIPNQSLIGPTNPYAAGSQQKSNSDMNIQDFLKIMAATISNPSMSGESSGGGQQDYMTQMATFSQMEQMSTMSDLLSSSVLMLQQQQAINLSGKQVTVVGKEASAVEGIVEKVRFSNGYASIQVNGEEYNLNDIIEVGEAK